MCCVLWSDGEADIRASAQSTQSRPWCWHVRRLGDSPSGLCLHVCCLMRQKDRPAVLLPGGDGHLQFVGAKSFPLFGLRSQFDNGSALCAQLCACSLAQTPFICIRIYMSQALHPAHPSSKPIQASASTTPPHCLWPPHSSLPYGQARSGLWCSWVLPARSRASQSTQPTSRFERLKEAVHVE